MPLVWTCAVFRVSGCVDHFAAVEQDAYEATRNIISTLNFQLPEEEEEAGRVEEPLHSAEGLLGLAPRSYNHSLDAKLVRAKLLQITHSPFLAWMQ